MSSTLEDSFEQRFVLDCATKAYFVAKRLGLDHEEASDCGQEVAVKVLALVRGPESKGIRHLEAFVNRILVNAAYDRHRRRKREQRHVSYVDGSHLATLDRPLASAPDALTLLGDGEDSERLRQCLNQLEVDDRRLVVELYFNERTLAELARTYGCAAATVWNRRKKAIRSLRKCMDSKLMPSPRSDHPRTRDPAEDGV